MIKYNLIENPKLQGQWRIVSDENCNDGDYYISKVNSDICKWTKSSSYWTNGYGVKVIASTHIGYSLPLIREEQLREFIDVKIGTFGWLMRKIAQEGYKGFSVEEMIQVLNNKLYTKEDLRKSFECGVIHGADPDAITQPTDDKEFTHMLTSLEHPTKYEIELEMEPYDGTTSIVRDWNGKMKVDKEGYIKIKNIKPI